MREFFPFSGKNIGLGIILVIPAGFAFSTDAPWVGVIERAILINGLVWMEILAISGLFPGLVRLPRWGNRIGLGIKTHALDFYQFSWQILSNLEIIRNNESRVVLSAAITFWVALTAVAVSSVVA